MRVVGRVAKQAADGFRAQARFFRRRKVQPGVAVANGLKQGQILPRRERGHLAF